MEGRVVLSTASAAGILHAPAAVSSQKTQATQTTLAISPGTLGSQITFTATVKAHSGAQAPAGSVKLSVAGQVLQTVPVTATGKAGVGQASYTFTPTIGGAGLFFGKYPVIAQFIPSTGFARSAATKALTIHQPNYTTLSDGVKYATVIPGSGSTAIQSGQTASVMYTGYLTTGQIFDDSVNDGGTPFQFKLGSGEVIPGFDEGTTGMKVGETRVIEIPAAEGYGSSSTGAIPANSTLIFVITLQGIS